MLEVLGVAERVQRPKLLPVLPDGKEAILIQIPWGRLGRRLGLQPSHNLVAWESNTPLRSGLDCFLV